MNYYLIALSQTYLGDSDPIVASVVVVPDDGDSQKVALVTGDGVASGPIERPENPLEALPEASSMLLNYRGKYDIEMEFSDGAFDLTKVARRMVYNTLTFGITHSEAYPDEKQAVAAARDLLGKPLVPSTAGKDQA